MPSEKKPPFPVTRGRRLREQGKQQGGNEARGERRRGGGATEGGRKSVSLLLVPFIMK